MAFQPEVTALVGVEFAGGAGVQRPGDQATEIAGAEPDLIFQEGDAELAVVAVEDGGGDWFSHGAPPANEAKGRRILGTDCSFSNLWNAFLGQGFRCRELRNPPETGRTYFPFGSCISPLPT